MTEAEMIFSDSFAAAAIFLYVFLLKKCNNNKEKQIGCVIIYSHNCVIMCDLA